MVLSLGPSRVVSHLVMPKKPALSADFAHQLRIKEDLQTCMATTSHNSRGLSTRSGTILPLRERRREFCVGNDVYG